MIKIEQEEGLKEPTSWEAYQSTTQTPLEYAEGPQVASCRKSGEILFVGRDRKVSLGSIKDHVLECVYLGPRNAGRTNAAKGESLCLLDCGSERPRTEFWGRVSKNRGPQVRHTLSSSSGTLPVSLADKFSCHLKWKYEIICSTLVYHTAILRIFSDVFKPWFFCELLILSGQRHLASGGHFSAFGHDTSFVESKTILIHSKCKQHQLLVVFLSLQIKSYIYTRRLNTTRILSTQPNKHDLDRTDYYYLHFVKDVRTRDVHRIRVRHCRVW